MLSLGDSGLFCLLFLMATVGFVTINCQSLSGSQSLPPSASRSATDRLSKNRLHSEAKRHPGDRELFFKDIQGDQEGSGVDGDDLDENAPGKGIDDEDSAGVGGKVDKQGSGGGPLPDEEDDDIEIGSGDPPSPTPSPPKQTDDGKKFTKDETIPRPTTESVPGIVSPEATPETTSKFVPTPPSSPKPSEGEPGGNNIDDSNEDKGVFVLPRQPPASFFARPGILAAVIGGAVVGLLCAILLVMFIVYRMRKKDEGSYTLDEPKRTPTNPYSRGSNKEYYA